MIAFEENGAAYWVINTLLDGLSNETMIAIAKGLKPLPQERRLRAIAAKEPHRDSRRGLGRPRHRRPASPSSAIRSSCATSCRSGSPTLEAGRVPIHEPGLEELIARNRERLRFTLDIEDVFADASIAFVCVGTPSTYSGDADLSAVWHVLDELPAFEERALLVMKSTVPVGTGEKVRHALDARGLAHVGYVSNPEFLAEGTAVHDFMHPDRVVVGAFADADGDAVAALYEPLDSADRAHRRRLGRDDQARRRTRSS